MKDKIQTTKVTHLNLLGGDDMKLYWISWSEDSVKLGTGRTIGMNEIVQLVDIKSDKFSTMFLKSDGAEGIWSIPLSKSMACL